MARLYLLFFFTIPNSFQFSELWLLQLGKELQLFFLCSDCTKILVYLFMTGCPCNGVYLLYSIVPYKNDKREDTVNLCCLFFIQISNDNLVHLQNYTFKINKESHVSIISCFITCPGHILDDYVIVPTVLGCT